MNRCEPVSSLGSSSIPAFGDPKCSRFVGDDIDLHRGTLTVQATYAKNDRTRGGWQTIAMAERYSHLPPAHKSQAVEKLAGLHNAFHKVKGRCRWQRCKALKI
jgi:hypothetical protein